MKRILFLLLLLPAFTFAQTSQELSTILSASGQDWQVAGQGSQLTLNNNILLATAGSGATDAVSGNTISYRSVNLQIVPASGTVTAGAITFEGSNDNFVSAALPVYLYDVSSITAAPVTTYSIVASTPRYFAGNIPFKYFRARISTGITGTTTGVQAFATYKSAPYTPNALIVVQPTGANLNVTPASTPSMTGAQASAAAGDATANITSQAWRDMLFQFNGSTWDRQYNNYNTTTGDAGTKTASFNGATQTNFNAKGAYITVVLGTVSGTTPTLQVQLQWSPDAGTTWLSFGAPPSNATTTGQTVGVFTYPTNWSITPGASPTTFTTGVSTYVMNNAPLPRTWRILYTIGGTTPSFAITAVYVNYIL